MEGPAPGPLNLSVWSSDTRNQGVPPWQWLNPVCSTGQSFCIADLAHATPGSAGLDLSTSARAVLTAQMGVQALPTNVFGPLPRETLGLIIGRSSTILRGIQIHAGVVDADYQGEIKIMTSVTQGVTVILQGDRIAQLVLVPLVNTSKPVARSSRGAEGFWSSGTAAFFGISYERKATIGTDY